MAYKRKSSPYRSPPKIKRIRKSRNWWSGSAVPRPVARGSGQGQIVNLTRYCELTTFTLDGTTDYFALAFQLNQLPNNTEFDLYDQYRIKYVKVFFTSNSMPVNNSTTANQVAPELITAVDYDDSTSPAAVSDLYNYNNCKLHGILHAGIPYYSRTLKPMVAQAIFKGVTNAYSARANVWLDTANKDVPHYGLKGTIIGQPNTGGSGFVKVTAQFFLEFKLPV